MCSRVQLCAVVCSCVQCSRVQSCAVVGSRVQSCAVHSHAHNGRTCAGGEYEGVCVQVEENMMRVWVRSLAPVPSMSSAAYTIL